MKLFIGTQPNPDDRLQIEVSEADVALIDAAIPRGSLSRKTVAITDQNTGKQYNVQRASCGLPRCRCALKLAV